MAPSSSSVSSSVLAAGNLAKTMVSCLTVEQTPQLKSPFDAVALASHSAMLAVGFRLVGLGEDDRIESRAENEQQHTLPTPWNASSSHYAFRYAHSQSSMEYLLKVNRMGNKAVLMGMGMGDDKTASFDIKVADYVSESSLPSSPLSEGTSVDDAAQQITHVFISEGRLSDFGASMRLNIIQKLIPSLQKEGYEESRSAENRAETSSASTQRADPPRRGPDPAGLPHPLYDPLAEPRRPFPSGDFPPPGFEDPYDMTRPPRPMPGHPGFGNIGERDLYPQGLGPNDPIRGGLGPGFGGGMGGGGMHPTFDDPLFGGRQGQGRGYDPQAPPGSRYDPVGPGGAPRGAGGRPHNPFGGFGSGDFI